MSFTEKLDLKLIKAVRDNPLLYDLNDCQYMDFNARDVVWQKIGDQLRCPASDCKSRWINIRDINRRILRKKLKHPEQKGNLYKYSAELNFMRPFYKDVMIQNADFSESCDNDRIANENVNSDNSYSSDESNDPKPNFKELRSAKRKKKKIRNEDIEKPASSTMNINDSATASGDLDPCDQVDAFLLSIGATLKTFSPYHLNLAKSQIFAVVQEHDLQQIVKQGQSTNSSGQINSVDSMFKNTME